MEIVREKIDEVTALLKVNVQPEDYRDGVNVALKEYARKANLPGFRPGKVPLSVIKNMVGKAIVLDELNKTLMERVNTWIRENEIEIIGEPLPKPLSDINLDPDANTAYDFLYEIGLVPEFKLNLNVSGFPDELTVMVDDAFLDREINTLRKRHGKMENPETCGQGDLLFGFLTESEKDKYVAGKRLRKAYVLNPERGTFSTSLLSAMIGKKDGDILPLKMSDLFSNENEVKGLWEEHPENGEHFHLNADMMKVVMEMDFQFEVKKVNRVIPEELNKEFFDKVAGVGKAANEEEFRNVLRDEVQNYLNRESAKFFRTRVTASLVDGNEIDLSTAFLRRWLIASRENVNEQNVDEMIPGYLRDLRWSLIVNEILRQNPTYNVSEEDVKANTRKMIGAEYGISGDHEKMEEMVEKFIEDKDFFRNMTMQALDEKIFQHILAEVNPKKTEISATDFVKML